MTKFKQCEIPTYNLLYSKISLNCLPMTKNVLGLLSFNFGSDLDEICECLSVDVVTPASKVDDQGLIPVPVACEFGWLLPFWTVTGGVVLWVPRFPLTTQDQ